MLESSDLRLFLRIVELEGISAAARSLGMPKSSVSRKLARLEEQAGAALLERTPQNLRLTDAGHLLAHHARRIVDDVVEAETALGGLTAKPSGDLRIAVPSTFAAGTLAAMLAGFMDSYPEVRVLLTLATRPVDLLAEDIDLVITMGPLPDSELISCRICSIPLRFCTSPRYLEPRSPLNHVSNLANHRILNHYDGRQALPCRDAECKVPDFMFVPHLVAREPAVLLSFALGGAGITLLPAVYVRDAVTRADLVRVLPELDFGTVDVHICFA